MPDSELSWLNTSDPVFAGFEGLDTGLTGRHRESPESEKEQGTEDETESEKEEEPEEDAVVTAVMAYLRAREVTMPQLIQRWLGASGRRYRRRLRSLQRVLPKELISIKTLETQLARLRRLPFFDRYQVEKSMDKVDLADVDDVVGKTAPDWRNLLHQLLRNQRLRDDEPVQDMRNLMRKRVTVLTAIVAHSTAVKDSNWWQQALGVFLMTSGVKRRVFDVLNNMGLVSSFVTIQRLMKGISAQQLLRAQALARDQQTYVAYDNFNRQQTRRDQVVGDINEQVNMTTSYIARNVEIPPGGLRKGMLDFKRELKASDVIHSICTDRYGKATAKWHIDDAVRSVFKSQVAAIFEDADPVEWPVIEELSPDPVDILSLPVSMHDEQKISETYLLQEDIWLRFLDLDRNEAFDDRLWIVVGDQMTVERIRGIQMESTESETPFDRRDWMLPSPAWFHIAMNCSYTLMRTHWSRNEDQQHLDHCLSDDIRFWGLKGISDTKPKFYLLQQLIFRSFRARVLALMMQEMIDRNWLSLDNAPADISRVDAVGRAIQCLTSEQYLELIDAVYDKAFTAKAWRNTDDPAFTTMVRMLKEMELFLTIRRAIRRMDIGHLRRAVDHLIIPFSGAGQHNYGREMIFMRWLLSDAADPALQRAILATGVINPSGKHGMSPVNSAVF